MQHNLLDYLSATLARCPDKIAIDDGERRISFKTLAGEATALANRIIAISTTKNRPVLLFLDRSADAVVAMVSALLARQCYCPVDLKSPDARLRQIIANVDPAAVVTLDQHAQRLKGLGVACPVLTLAPTVREEVGFDTLLSQTLAVVIDTDPAYVIYTSGSTGVPKGVTVGHRSVIDYIDWAVATFAVSSGDRIANQAPFYFDNSTLDIYLCLATGATLLIVPSLHFTFPVNLIDYLRTERVTFIFWVPSVLVNLANLDLLANETLPELRKILFAGEAMPAKQLGYWMARLEGRVFTNLYGPTEITVDCTFAILTAADIADGQVPIGKACRNSEVLILTDQDMPADDLENGELCVRGSSLALGYWRDPAKTAAAFVQNPLNADFRDPIYRTGDLVHRRVDGNIIFVGRKDSQIKHLGYRIELGEIEHQALGIPGIANACVVYDHPKKAITLFFQPLGAEVPVATIRKALSEILPKYMLPTAFHPMERLPMNPNGKIDRNGLMLSLAQGG